MKAYPVKYWVEKKEFIQSGIRCSVRKLPLDSYQIYLHIELLQPIKVIAIKPWE